MNRLRFLWIVILVSGCDSTFPGFDEKFGKQHFVTTISLVELHKIRNGNYPESLKDLRYLGDWDGIALSRVRYEKVDAGYNLFVETGWMGEPDLKLPIDFKKGLGLQESNVEWITG